MKRIMLVAALLGLLLLTTALPASADALTLTGTISAANLLPNGRLNDSAPTCSALESGVFYYDLFEITPATSGTYYYADAGYLTDDPAYIDGWIAVYTGPAASFDPSVPAGNGCFANFDDTGSVSLTGGVTYTVMVSSYDPGETGTYLLYLNNEPFYFSETLNAGPTLTGGRWDDGELGCTSQNGDPDHYYTTTTFTPGTSAVYLFIDYREFASSLDIYLGIYDGPFDPANPLANCIANFDDDGAIFLTAGVTYTLVMTNYTSGATGTGAYLLFGPGGGAVAQNCPYPLPSGSIVYSVPAGAPTFWAADLATQTDLILPTGTWWISEFDGDFAKVWIACQAQPVWIPTNAIAR